MSKLEIRVTTQTYQMLNGQPAIRVGPHRPIGSPQEKVDVWVLTVGDEQVLLCVPEGHGQIEPLTEWMTRETKKLYAKWEAEQAEKRRNMS